MISSIIETTLPNDSKKLLRLLKKYPEERDVLFNSAIIQLTTGFEVFCESSVKEFVERINKIEIPANKMPDHIKIKHTSPIIEDTAKKLNYREKISSQVSNLKEISKIWNENNSSKLKVNISHKLQRGKHGEIEIKKIFQRIGIENILSKIPIPSEPNDSLYQTIEKSTRESEAFITEIIQNITRDRNLSIHQGVNIGARLSDDDLEKTIAHIEFIASEIRQVLTHEIGKYLAIKMAHENINSRFHATLNLREKRKEKPLYSFCPTNGSRRIKGKRSI